MVSLFVWRAYALLVCVAVCALSQDITFGVPPSGGAVENSCTTPDAKRGTCGTFANCPSLKKHLTNRNLDFLKRSICGRRNGRPLLCCPTAGELSPVTPLTRTPFRSPRDCGRSRFSPGRVVGGAPVESALIFPWMTALKYPPEEDKPDHRCGGSIINERWVLTAAHCITPNGPKYATIRDVILNSENDDDFSHPPEDVEVQQAFKHTEFKRLKRGALINDIALLKLKTSITFSEYVHPICIDRKVRLTSEFEAIQRVYVAGWGFTEFGGHVSPHMQWARVGVFPHQRCLDNYGRNGVTLSDQSQLCANGNDTSQEGCDELLNPDFCRGGKDTCSGDSGGPLMELRTVFNQPRFFTIGIVSFGTGCGNPDFPGIYTRVDHYLDWMGAIVKDN